MWAEENDIIRSEACCFTFLSWLSEVLMILGPWIFQHSSVSCQNDHFISLPFPINRSFPPRGWRWVTKALYLTVLIVQYCIYVKPVISVKVKTSPFRASCRLPMWGQAYTEHCCRGCPESGSDALSGSSLFYLNCWQRTQEPERTGNKRDFPSSRQDRDTQQYKIFKPQYEACEHEMLLFL